MEKREYVVALDDPSFAYDVHSLYQAFYPHTRISVVTDARDADFYVQVPVDVCRTEAKNSIKRQIYDTLVAKENRELPWGTLTGIRPTKIALKRLLSGETEDMVADYMRGTYRTSDKKTALALAVAAREKEVLSSVAERLLPENSVADPFPGDITAVLAEGYSLYIGIPFCPSICLYCSFSSYPYDAYAHLAEDYMAALFREMDAVASLFAERKLTTVYIGGGTPTTLSAKQLHRLLCKLKETFDLSHVLELTVEAGRCDSLTEEKLNVIAEHFNGNIRISINPQTFSDDTLRLIGRRHTADEVRTAYQKARQAGIKTINMDLIMGLPKETIEDVRHTLKEAAALAPDNLTVHALAIKRSSALHELLVTPQPKGGDSRGKETAMSVYADEMREHGDAIMAMVHEAAEKMGMRPYYLYRQKNIAGNLENTGFAPEGKEGLYNILIMEELQDIVALGAGAACKCLCRDANGMPLYGAKIRRCENVKNVTEYIGRIDEMIERKRVLYAPTSDAIMK